MRLSAPSPLWIDGDDTAVGPPSSLAVPTTYLIQNLEDDARLNSTPAFMMSMISFSTFRVPRIVLKNA
jgi:hypothetical protein